VVAFDDDHGPDALLAHPLGDGRHRLVGGRSHDRLAHDLADGSCRCGHARDPRSGAP
jgi:hypothetical protein